MPGYDTVIVTTDLSDPSVCALTQAADLAERLGSRLILVYVVDDRLPAAIEARVGDPDALLRQHRDHAESNLKKLVAERLAGRDVETVIRQGTAHQEIVRMAEERKADLIVMGMHGHGFLVHALAGSTTERVLHKAPCPVLVVPHRG